MAWYAKTLCKSMMRSSPCVMPPWMTTVKHKVAEQLTALQRVRVLPYVLRRSAARRCWYRNLGNTCHISLFPSGRALMRGSDPTPLHEVIYYSTAVALFRDMVH
eukprot:jgi/Ulvmu1/5782/UM025_0036.1